MEPVPPDRPSMYTHPYENFRIELRPSQGAVMTIKRQVPAVYTPVMVID